MVPGVIVGIAKQDVEHEPSVQFVQRRLRIRHEMTATFAGVGSKA